MRILPQKTFSSAQLVRRAILTAAVVTLLIGSIVFYAIYRNALSAEAQQTAIILHRTATELLIKPLEISDYIEIKRVLGRISTGPAKVTLLPPVGNLILSDDVQLSQMKKDIAGLDLSSCKTGNEPIFFRSPDKKLITCSAINPSNPIAETNVAPTLLISRLSEGDHPISIGFYFTSLSFVAILIILLVSILNRILMKHLVAPIQSIANAIESETIEQVDSRLRTISAGTTPSEVLIATNALVGLIARVKSEIQLREKLAAGLVKNQLARQVAHDIRSPLFAIQVACSNLKGPDVDTRNLLLAASSSISNIASKLLAGIDTESNIQVEMVDSILILLAQQKRTELTHLEIDLILKLDERSYGSFSVIDKVALERLCSNIINNAAEASKSGGSICLELIQRKDILEIKITDDGYGIPSDVLEKIGREAFTFGKKGGHGLGLSDAYQTVERWGGKLSITSKVGSGTCVSISLERCEPPGWFVPSLAGLRGMNIVIVDDHVESRVVIERRLGVVPCWLHNEKDLVAWLADRSGHSFIFLVDFEFQVGSMSGIDLIQKYLSSDNCILVTHRSDDPHVLQKCKDLRLKMIPKSTLELIPV